jgi:hypothetical protein
MSTMERNWETGDLGEGPGGRGRGRGVILSTSQCRRTSAGAWGPWELSVAMKKYPLVASPRYPLVAM